MDSDSKSQVRESSSKGSKHHHHSSKDGKKRKHKKDKEIKRKKSQHENSSDQDERRGSNESTDALLTQKEEDAIDRALDVMSIPRITPVADEPQNPDEPDSPRSQQEDEASPSASTAASSTPEQPSDLSTGDQSSAKPEAPPMDPLTTVIAAQYLKVCADLASLENLRQSLSPLVPEEIRLAAAKVPVAPKKRKSPATGAAQPDKKRKVSGYSLFLQEQKTNQGAGEKGGIRAYQARWRGLTEEEKSVWNKRAEAIAAEASTAPSTEDA
eukprot:Blabericola_migrator_1__3318@NODE_1978_length_3475_cov_199_857981_g1259_i0_p3_GENE_NODE_1978_length_3475_cov_199_857981_g1259_i0NODE_1978_length_3475_cov_199_857981_g1259_i0_p3_ORF_typecomplete_len269_score60_41HMG_box_2/PF09011_10/4_5e03HMG_box_2/PF09011_10/1_5e05HMG_box/PF00505_19/6_1e03HMG_box/PF00505_19/0_00024U79_P34/PF03064_16/2SOBP/PF15279_6/2_1Herpes_LMP1/PF05297_11/4_3Ccdc124/PF06244_12/0_12Ccdc124/PF06244_12/3_1e03_NODE_1978_length_3475_cov_199_857981_g1259_i017772583